MTSVAPKAMFFIFLVQNPMDAGGAESLPRLPRPLSQPEERFYV